MPLVPTLTDGVVTLRPPHDDDLQGCVEQSSDPQSRRWTTVPVPYTRDDAATYLRHIIPGGWETDREWAFVVQADDEDGHPRFGGIISLRNEGAGRAEVAYGSHPWIRGRGLMERALRLLLDWGFAERDLQSVSWLASRGNWASRRLAWRLGFVLEGTLTRWLVEREGLGDAWVGTLQRGVPMEPRSLWLESPTLRGRTVVLRRLLPADLARAVETLNDPEVQHWLQGPRESAPHTAQRDAGLLDERLADAADGRAVHWAVADPASEDYLGEVSLFEVQHRRQAELGYLLHPDSRGRGVMGEAVSLVVHHALVPWEDGGLGLHRLVAGADTDNAASRVVLERAGFVRVGTDRRSNLLPDGGWSDDARYDLLVEDYAPADGAPTG